MQRRRRGGGPGGHRSQFPIGRRLLRCRFLFRSRYRVPTPHFVRKTGARPRQGFLEPSDGRSENSRACAGPVNRTAVGTDRPGTLPQRDRPVRATSAVDEAAEERHETSSHASSGTRLAPLSLTSFSANAVLYWRARLRASSLSATSGRGMPSLLRTASASASRASTSSRWVGSDEPTMAGRLLVTRKLGQAGVRQHPKFGAKRGVLATPRPGALALEASKAPRLVFRGGRRHLYWRSSTMS